MSKGGFILLDRIKNHILRHNEEYYEKKIKRLLKIAQEKQMIDASSSEMIENILQFRDILAREVMIPRTAIVAISADTPIAEIIKEMADSGLTRIPVYRGTIDNIIGILNVKDLLKFWSKQVTREDIIGCLRKPYYIPETKNIKSLFYELKEKKYHMAVVIDEYGGTSGLISFEDVLEEIVGEIHDEYDIQTDLDGFIKLADGTIIIDARMEIEKVEEYLNISFTKGQYETIGGLILHTIKKIPLPGEMFQIEGREIIIENADERSIKKIRIKPNQYIDTKREINT